MSLQHMNFMICTLDITYNDNHIKLEEVPINVTKQVFDYTKCDTIA